MLSRRDWLSVVTQPQKMFKKCLSFHRFLKFYMIFLDRVARDNVHAQNALL